MGEFNYRAKPAGTGRLNLARIILQKSLAQCGARAKDCLVEYQPIMKSTLLYIIDKAIETIRAFFQSTAALREQLKQANATVAELTSQVADLQQKLKTEESDDEALLAEAAANKARADAAEARFAEIDAELTAATAKASELAEMITGHDETPVVTPTFEVVPMPPAPAISEETSTTAVEPAPTVNSDAAEPSGVPSEPATGESAEVAANQ